MTKETKIGLLVGLCIIVIIGIVVTDHLSIASNQDPANLTDFAPGAYQAAFDTPAPRATNDQYAGRNSDRNLDRNLDRKLDRPTPRPLPLPQETPSDPNHPIHRATAPARPQTTSPLAIEQVVSAQRITANSINNTPSPLTFSAPPPAPLNTATAQQTDATSTVRVVPPTGRTLTPITLQTPRSTTPASTSHSASPPASTQYNPAPAPASNMPRVVVRNETTNQTAPRLTIPDTPTPAPAPAPTSTASANTTPTRNTPIHHRVESGESLYVIAKRYYGNGEYWRTIAAANPKLVDKNGGVKADVLLTIPDKAGLANRTQLAAAVKSISTPSNKTANSNSGKSYTVKPGDTLSSIASSQLGDERKWYALFQANQKALDGDADHLIAGQKLVIP